ncbi:hemolysin III family protein [Schleiferilactobacillus harbinensis]|uniref:Hemolysin III family protein n=1 Tax=Schleiferilactobacillus harbinensis TaxID=304207 RepID=A0A510TWZ5_9LACO|nr:hemolysin III family protein [Schleiferilactobacillus harbinensis]MCI1687076.1 hemolysin III family protein [Schleiferilactobacillus harbinensis]MCI1783880.1 hemolysin III family protein [Schleiferilactobacillus harbinensis]MCI1851360.1 hemolysin III family protein [Schleiferilactobacillus harbinensis]QEU47454.1 hemolysin III family protein [Schleiferilactobacillus harbinensis]QFR24539.1 hemolysin III family protein [Schleiferilactobacillus harbinensis]
METHHVSRYRIHYEVKNAVSHGVWFLVSIWLVTALWLRAGAHHAGPLEMTALVIYGVTLLNLFLASTMCHAMAFTKAARIFQILDHSGIYLFIAGTYTAYTLVAIGGVTGWVMLAIEWFCAIAGIVIHVVSGNPHQNIETLLYIIMGWLCIAAAPTLWRTLGPVGFWFLVSGGVVFTLGAGIYSIKKLKEGHFIWHFLVIIASTLMYVSIYWLV